MEPASRAVEPVSEATAWGSGGQADKAATLEVLVAEQWGGVGRGSAGGLGKEEEAALGALVAGWWGGAGWGSAGRLGEEEAAAGQGGFSDRARRRRLRWGVRQGDGGGVGKWQGGHGGGVYNKKVAAVREN
jgi:hypothetical protein